jgi:ankyrin repeat protein
METVTVVDAEPLWKACKAGNSALAMTSLHIRPTECDKYDSTALMWACTSAMSEVALAILATGHAKPEHANDSDDTALILACISNMSEAALAILASGQANPEHVNINGSTALLYACRKKMSEVALAIIAIGNVNLDYVNKNGKTAIDLAMENNMTIVVGAIRNALLRSKPSKHLAQFAYAAAITAGDICLISHEPLADSPSVWVNRCGHIVGSEYGMLQKCPMCQTTWNPVELTR